MNPLPKVKICSKCGQTKSLDDFYKRTSSKDSLYSWCKECTKKSSKLYQKKNINKVREAQRNRRKKFIDHKKTESSYWVVETSHKNFARQIGISFEELEFWYKKQWMKQQAQCAICGKVFSGDEHIDHDHKTNKLRGLLCGNCNRALGMLKENINTVENLINYIKQFAGPPK